nr:hypothetical protein CFP56_28116 [Quercus suber]
MQSPPWELHLQPPMKRLYRLSRYRVRTFSQWRVCGDRDALLCTLPIAGPVTVTGISMQSVCLGRILVAVHLLQEKCVANVACFNRPKLQIKGGKNIDVDSNRKGKEKVCDDVVSTVGRDANDNMYPIAMAIVETKSKDSCLLKDLGPVEQLG